MPQAKARKFSRDRESSGERVELIWAHRRCFTGLGPRPRAWVLRVMWIQGQTLESHCRERTMSLGGKIEAGLRVGKTGVSVRQVYLKSHPAPQDPLQGRPYGDMWDKRRVEKWGNTKRRE